MNQAELTKLESDSHVELTNKPPYKLYGGVIVLIVVARLLDLATQHMNWTVWVYGQAWCWLAFGSLALVVGFFAAPRLRVHTPAVMAILICGLLGGVLNIVTNATVGMVCGVVGASFSVFDSPRQFVIRALYTKLLPVLLASVAVGVTSAMLLVLITPRTEMSDRLCWLVPLILGFGGLAIWTRWQRRKNQGRNSLSRVFVGLVLTWPLRLFFLTALSTAVFLFTLNWELERRDGAMTNVVAGGSYCDFLGPYATTKLQKQVAESIELMLMRFHRGVLDFGANSGAPEVAYAKGFPRLLDIMVRPGSRLTDEEFAQLDTRFLQSLAILEGTKLTDKSIRTLDMSRLQYLTLQGPNFGDDAIVNLSKARTLWQLNLRDTNVTSSAVAKINPASTLWSIDLTRTNVDDSIVTFLGKRGITALDLRGTKVTGATLKSLRGSTMHRLDLSDTQIETKYLLDLLPAETVRDLPAPTIVFLDLSNVPLTPEELVAISTTKGLRHLSVAGSEIGSASLDALTRIPTLQSLTIDVDQLPSEVLGTMPSSIELKLVFDEDQPPEEIIDVASKIRQHRRDVNDIIVDGFRVNEESMRAILSIDWIAFNISLRNATLPDGSTTDFGHFSHLVDYANENFPQVIKDTATDE